MLGDLPVRLPSRVALGIALRGGRRLLRQAARELYKQLRDAIGKAHRWSRRQRQAASRAFGRQPKAWHKASRAFGRELRTCGASLRRRVSWSTTFIGVTGSCGKTTVSNLVGTILGHKGKCFVCVDCNYDTDVASTVLALPISARFCIQEAATIRRA